MKKEIKDQTLDYNIETLLSNIEQKINIMGGGTLNKLKKGDFKKLLKEIKKQVRKISQALKPASSVLSN